MLKNLQIKDYALIEAVEVEFNSGLNIITGETGAGKSILLDAMSLLLGERASNDFIRKGSQKAVVEGIFDVEKNKKIKALLEENEIDYLPELIVRREISLKGTNRSFLNDTPVTLNLIKDVGNLLVDLHGQHEHQSLLRTETHIEFLDEFGTPEELITSYQKKYNELSAKTAELRQLKNKENLLKEKKDLYGFQIKEIDAVSPVEGEEEALTNELNILENSEKLMELTSDVYQSLYESEGSVHDALTRIKNEIEQLVSIDNSFAEVNGEAATAVELIKDISEFIRNYNSRIDLDPGRLEEMRDRVGAINLIKKKYGGTVKAVLEYRGKIGEEFRLADNYTESITGIEENIKKIKTECAGIAAELTKSRKASAKKVEKEVVEILKQLGIENSVFKVNFDKTELNVLGADSVEFFISTNLGEDVKPLAKVASGGEVSRIMLSLKTILAKNDKLPLLIFDEIDTGVSGRIALKVGQALKNLSTYHQIIAITHLPQISGMADHHFAVEKKSAGERVSSSIRKLSDEERIREVAKLMSGENITDASLKGARELMGL